MCLFFNLILTKRKAPHLERGAIRLPREGIPGEDGVKARRVLAPSIPLVHRDSGTAGS